MPRSSRMRRISSPSPSISVWLRPPAGSSSSSSFGRAASARASSTRFCSAERQVGDAAVRDVGEVEKLDQLPGDVGERCSSRRGPGQLQRIAEEIAAAERMAADAHIVEHRHGAEQREVLERAADADLGDAVRRAVEDALPFEQDVAASRRVEAAEAVEQRGLAGAVRADQAEQLALARS